MSTILDLADRRVDLNTGRLEDGTELRPMELKVLRYLAARAGQIVSQRELLVAVWGYAEKTRSSTAYSTGGEFLLKVRTDAGHRGPSGRYRAIDNTAWNYAWVLDRLGLADTRPFEGARSAR